MRLLITLTVLVATLVPEILGQKILDNSETAFKTLQKQHQDFEEIGRLGDELQIQYEKLKSFVSGMNAHGNFIGENVEKFLQNPLNQLHFMNRYVKEWEVIRGMLREIKRKKAKIELLKTSHEMATQRSNGLDFIQSLADLYELDAANFSKGILRGISASGKRLTADECITVAVKAYGKGRYSQCAEWMEEAYWRIRGGEKSTAKLESVASDVLTCRKLFNKKESLDLQLYKRLCKMRSNYVEEKGNLKCYLIQGKEDYWSWFNAVKVEPISVDPNITLYHDLIPNNKIEYLKRKTHDSLISTNETVDSIKFGFSAATGELRRMLDGTKRRLGLIHGLPMEKFDYIRITHIWRRFYTTFNPSTTVFTIVPPDFNFKLYLTDVDHGGATVFRYPASTIIPRKGSALIWADDVKMAECPVLYGDYWTAELIAKVPEYKFLKRSKVDSLWDLDDWEDYDFDWLDDMKQYDPLFVF